MASEDIEIRVWQSAEGLDASVQCPSFVDRHDAFESVADALAWVTSRIERASDPFTYEDD